MKVLALLIASMVVGLMSNGVIIAEQTPEGFVKKNFEAEFYSEKSLISAVQKPPVETRSATRRTATSGSNDWTTDVTVARNSFWYPHNGFYPDSSDFFRALAHNSAEWNDERVLSSQDPLSQPSWTFMVYLDGDNNLEHAYIRIFELMETASENPDVTIVVQFDRIHYPNPDQDDSSYGDWTDCRRFLITLGVTPAPGNEVQILGEVNMADPDTLEDFIRWAKTDYPADHYLLAVVNHGGGWMPAGEQQLTSENPVPTGIVWDYTSGGDYMSTAELGYALSSASSGGTDKLDIVFLDACLMQMIEVGYQIKDYSQFLVASEYTAWAPGPYDNYISSIRSTTTPLQLTSSMADEYHNWLTGRIYAHTLSSINLGQLDNLAQETDNLAQALIVGLTTCRAPIENSRNDCQKLSKDSYIDLYHFAYLIQQNSADASVRRAAQEVITTINNTVVAEAHESGGGDRYYPLNNTHGISIYFPASQFDQGYNDYNPSNLAFVGDTRWDEFLTAFFMGVPDIRIPFSTLTFGNVTVGDTLDLDRTIYNDGTVTLTVYSITCTSGSSDFTCAGPATPFDIEPESSKTITLQFTPTSPGPKSASFNVNSNDPDEPHVPFDLFGSGMSESELSYSPTSHDFGTICIGELDSITFELWNSGNGTLIASLHEDCHWVTVHPTSASSVGERDTITVNINTTGLSEGTHSCAIAISTNGGNGTFTVAMNLIAPEMEVSPEEIEMRVPLGRSDTTTMSIKETSLNCALKNVYVEALAPQSTIPEVAPIDPRWFIFSPNNFAVPAGEEVAVVCSVTIPPDIPPSGDTPWYYGGVLAITSANNGRINVSTVIHVIELPALCYAPMSYNFGDKYVGETDNVIFEIWNCGSGTLDYSLSADCHWVTVHPTSASSGGEHDTITVNITTTGLSEGYHGCTISVSSNGGNGTFSVAVNLRELAQPNLDTGSPATPYPSISGTHTGTITPSCDITVSKLFTYACVGTGGHTDYAKIFNDSWDTETLPWGGYQGDWQNISFSKQFTLHENKTYYYIIHTGSYPQIIHNSSLTATGGTITCEGFVDVNGKRHEDWIPAIRLE